MKIKNRLRKVETAANVGPDKRFCDCRENAAAQVTVIDAGGVNLSGEKLPIDCDKCRKTIESNAITIQGVESQTLAPI